MAKTTTLRSGISDLVNDLVKIGNNTTNADQQTALIKITNALMILWQQVIFDQLNAETSNYKDAIASLDDAKAAAAAAKKNLDDVAHAIEKATSAAKAIDKLINFAVKLLV
jgi:hypothetical protein